MASAAWAELGYCALSVNNLDLAKSLFHQGLTTPTAMMRLSRPKLLIGVASVSLEENNIDTALESIEEAQVYIDNRQMKHMAPYVSLVMGKIYIAKGEFEDAIEYFVRAEESAAEMGFLPVVWQAQANAAAALQKLNLNEQAKEKQDQALENIQEIKELFENQDLRDVFSASAMSELNINHSQLMS